MTETEFLKKLFDAYETHARPMPWRIPNEHGDFDPYKILVSEIMLQQTQVERVIPKFEAFVARFPSFESLSVARLSEILSYWQGLGYNRRAKYLHDNAQLLANSPFPHTVEELTAYKGIGHNTAAAILVYAFDTSLIYVETNIRTVLIHSFYADEEQVSDEVLIKKLERIVRTYGGSMRDFYWAMMDYGSALKKQGVKAHRKSASYTQQTKFEGSLRQLRGKLIRYALAHDSIENAKAQLADERFDMVLKALQAEGLVRISRGKLSIL